MTFRTRLAENKTRFFMIFGAVSEGISGNFDFGPENLQKNFGFHTVFSESCNNVFHTF